MKNVTFRPCLNAKELKYDIRRFNHATMRRLEQPAIGRYIIEQFNLSKYNVVYNFKYSEE